MFDKILKYNYRASQRVLGKSNVRRFFLWRFCLYIMKIDKLDRIKKQCDVCNNIFYTYRSNQKRCSKKCSNIRDSNLSREKREARNNLKLFNVFERDNFRCAYCGKTSYEDNVKLVVEHIFPRSKGGTNEGHNLITACSDCNNRKSDMILDWNIILTLWQIVDKRNKIKNIDWDNLKDVFDKEFKLKKS